MFERVEMGEKLENDDKLVFNWDMVQALNKTFNDTLQKLELNTRFEDVHLSFYCLAVSSFFDALNEIQTLIGDKEDVSD